MGFSIVAAAAIIGVSILMIIEIFTGGVLPSISNVNYSYKDMKDRAVDKVQADVNITSVSTFANSSNYDHNITVKNTGSITLKTGNFSVLIDGTTQLFTCNVTYLYPEKNAYFNVTNVNGTGAKRLKVITNNGVSDYHEYTI